MGSVTSFEQAQIEYKGKIRTFARNFAPQITGFDQEDVEQELLMVLWKCVQNYDPDRGASFNTLFQGSARNHCISLIRHMNTQSRKAPALYDIDDEATRDVINAMISDGSAEDWYLAVAEHAEAFAAESGSHTERALKKQAG